MARRKAAQSMGGGGGEGVGSDFTKGAQCARNEMITARDRFRGSGPMDARGK